MPDGEKSAAQMDRLEEFRQVASALSDSTRLRIVLALAAGPRHVTQLTEELELRQPLVSHHLAILAEAGLADVQREGRRRVYALKPVDPPSIPGLRVALADLAAVQPPDGGAGSRRLEDLGGAAGRNRHPLPDVGDGAESRVSELPASERSGELGEKPEDASIGGDFGGEIEDFLL